MNRRLIKEKADSLLLTVKPQFIRILMIMMLVNIIPSLLNTGNGVFSVLIDLVLLLAFLTFGHGIIVSSLKIVRNQGDTLEDQDAFVGFKKYKELFFTYFISNMFVLAVTWVIAIGAIVLVIILFGSGVGINNLVSMFTSNSIDVNSMMGYSAFPILTFIILLTMLLIVIASVVTSTIVFAMPYLYQQYGLTGIQALKESYKLIKGHIWELIVLQLSFFHWILLETILASVLVTLLAIPFIGTIIASVLVGMFGIYTYQPKLYLSLAIFFEELAYQRYESGVENFDEVE